MKKVYILSDNEKIKARINKFFSSNLDVKIVKMTEKIHEAIFDVIRDRPDFIIISMKEYSDRLKNFEKFNIIYIYENSNQPTGLKCENIGEYEIEDKLRKFFAKDMNESTKPNIVKTKNSKFDIVVIGVSTGGPYSLKEVVPLIKQEIKIPVIIIQHMPPGFTKDLAKGLSMFSKISVIEAEDGMELKNGMAYVMPGGRNMGIIGDSVRMKFKGYNQKYGFYTPSVDYMIESISELKSINPLVVIMTGMGNDGFEGIRKLKNDEKGFVMTQSKNSCVVYGMPRVIDEAGLADFTNIELKKIAEEINKRV